MKRGKFIKIDGVELNVDWVNSMTRDEFVSNPQVNRLFYRIDVSDRPTALSTIYRSVTGRKTAGGFKPVSSVKTTDPAEPITITDKGE